MLKKAAVIKQNTRLQITRLEIFIQCFKGLSESESGCWGGEGPVSRVCDGKMLMFHICP